MSDAVRSFAIREFHQQIITSCLFTMEYESDDVFITSTSKHCVNHEKYKFTRQAICLPPINIRSWFGFATKRVYDALNLRKLNPHNV